MAPPGIAGHRDRSRVLGATRTSFGEIAPKNEEAFSRKVAVHANRPCRVSS